MANRQFNAIGLDDLREALAAAGWTIYPDSSRANYNDCNWIACRTDDTTKPDCVCNDKPPQFIVWPTIMRINDDSHENAKVEIGGETRLGHWYRISTSTKPTDLMAALPDICRRLAAAWSTVAA